MKNTAKRITSLLILIALLTVALISCGATSSSGYCTVVVGEEGSFTEYKVELDGLRITEGVFSILKQLDEENRLDVNYESSTYGAYLTAIGSVTPDTLNGEYVAIYTSVVTDFDTSTYFTEYQYNGTKLGSSGLGISSMKVEADAIYLFTIGKY